MENPVNPREDISEKARNLTIRIMEDVRNFLRKAVERIKADKKLSRNLITAPEHPGGAVSLSSGSCCMLFRDCRI